MIPFCSADQATKGLNVEPMLYWPWTARLVRLASSGSWRHTGWPSSPHSGVSMRTSNSSSNRSPLMSCENHRLSNVG